MYAIIYWLNNKIVCPLLNKDGGIYLFSQVSEADSVAEILKNNSYKLDAERFKFVSANLEPTKNDDIECRVISIDGVSE